MATLTVNPTAGGTGRVGNTDGGTWAGTRDGATGNFADALQNLQTATTNVQRNFFPFDTSALTSGAVITAAKLRLYRDDSLVSFANSDSTSIEIVVSTQASTSALANSDYSLISFVSKGTLPFASTSNNAYAEISLTDLTIINKTGFTKLAIITGRDLNNNAPAGNNVFDSQAPAGANKPELVVTYTMPSGNFFNFF